MPWVLDLHKEIGQGRLSIRLSVIIITTVLTELTKRPEGSVEVASSLLSSFSLGTKCQNATVSNQSEEL